MRRSRSAGKFSGSRVRSPTGASASACGDDLDQAVAAEDVGHARRCGLRGLRGLRLFRHKAFRELRIEQAVGVVEGRPQDLAARNVLEGRGDAPLHPHLAGVDRLGGTEARQRGAEGARQEDRLDQVAARLLDRERRELAVIERALGHDAVDTERELLGYLRQRHLGHIAIAAPLMREQPMGVLDGAFASLDGYIHRSHSLAISPRGARIASMASSWTSTTSMPRGNRASLIASRPNRSRGLIIALQHRAAVDAGSF